MKFIIMTVAMALSISAYSQTGARVPDVKIKKTTGIVRHSAYSHFYVSGYKNLNIVLTDTLSKYGCQSKANIDIIEEPGIFSKGQFVGSIEINCYNPTIADINVYFEVYPHDEETASVVQVTLKNGKKENFADCWNFQGRDLKCKAQEMINVYGFNFK